MHYLDNSATTKVLENSAKKAYEMMTCHFGNPSSVHKLGISALSELKSARISVADLFGTSADRIFFTSCGTESINTAIFGATNKLHKRGKHIISTKVEHSATLKALEKLEGNGFEVTYLTPNRQGIISLDDFKNALREDTIFASVMHVNNEVGTKFDVVAMSKALKAKIPHALFHVDAVQSFAKVPMSEVCSHADFISVSGHKIGAPKGIGALYIKKGVSITPYLYGGGQENGMRSGTESLPLICAFAEACKERKNNLDKNNKYVEGLYDYLVNTALETFENSSLNGENTIPYIANISFNGLKSEVMLRILQDCDVYVSAGSACSKGKKSYVLSAMNVPHNLIDSALRISLCPENTKEDIDAFINAVKIGHDRLLTLK